MNGRQLSLCLLLLLLAAAFLLPRPAAAVCSDLRGRATINEVYRGNPFFLEVKILDPTLNLTGWNLRVCSQNQCTNAFPVTLGRQYGPYLVFDNTNSNNQLTSTILDFSKRDLDILLTDNQGFAVDYLNINNHSVQAGACNNYPYPTTITGSSNSFSIIRDPDGNGPFVFYGTGNSEPETPGNSNKDPGGLLPKVNGSDVTVPRGAPAVFTITLSKASATPTTVSYQTVADSALSGIHFEPVTGSITFPANNTTPITVTVNTIAGSPPPDGVYFWLNLTGATGAALNTHFLRGSLVGDQGAVHHYRLQHAGNALTCQRADVTVTACQNADCSSLYTGAVIVTLTPSGWIGGDTQTFSGGSALLQLRRNTAGTVTLGISSASPGAINPRQCSGGPAGALCALTFHTSGFIFDVPNLTACQSSGNVTIQAVRTSDTTQACVADGGFANSTRAVSFWTDYQVPASGSRALTLNGTSLAGSSPGTAINLNFNGSATALFTVSYPDAGQLQLNARFTGTGEAAGLVMIGSDSFIVRPARFNVAARGGATLLNNAASAGAPRWAAGDDFQVEVQSVCADNTVTPNFAAAVQLTPESPFAPATGVLGLLQNGALAATDFVAGTATRSDANYSEVGNFTLRAQTADYLGTGPVSGTALVGRFTPHHFAVSTSTPEFGTACAAGGFSYLGQPFSYTVPPVITVTALNRQNNPTRNYTGPWWKITNASLSGKTYTALTGSLDISAAPAIDPVIVDTGNGTGTLTFSSGAGFTFTRALPQSPFDSEIGLAINVADSDGIAPASNPVQFGDATAGNGIAFDAGKPMRYGRLNLLNAYGPEILPLPLPLRAEYYIDAASGWGSNQLDVCTLYASANLTLGPAWDGLGAGPTVAPAGSWALLGGTGDQLRLSAPGSAGNVGLTLTVPPWLRLDLNGDGVWQENPTARATFGIYKGNRRLIYMREAYR